MRHHPSSSIQPAVEEQVLRVRVEAPSVAPCWEGLFLLEEALDRFGDGAAARARLLEVSGDAPPFGLASLDAAGRSRLAAWGRRLCREVSAPGGLRVGWADGEVGGPLLELLLACDLLLVGPDARVTLFPPAAGYLPVAGGWTRAIRRAGSAAALEASLEGRTLTAAEAVARGLAAGVVGPADLRPAVDRLASGNGRALAAVADLARRAPGLGEPEAEALERAVFSWCFAAGDPAEAIRGFLAGDAPHDGAR